MKVPILMACIVVLSSAVAGHPPPSQLYVIQVAAISTSHSMAAQELVSRMQQEAWTPVRIQSTDPFAKVQFGLFETYPDALWWRYALRRRGYPDAFIVPQKNEDRTSGVQCSGPIVPNFKPVSREMKAASGGLEMVRLQAPVRLHANLERLMSETPERNTANSSDTVALISSLQALADGDAPGSLLDVCRARIAVANAWHYGGKPRWLTAYHCYGEALAVAPAGSPEEAECLLQRAALLMELAQSGKATMEECRLACQTVLERVPSHLERPRAVASLIHAEALFNEGRYDECIDEMMAVQAKWPQRCREVAAAKVYEGIACCKRGYFDLAEFVLLGAVDMEIPDGSFFQWRGVPKDPKKDAAQWLAHIYWTVRDTHQARYWERFASECEMRMAAQIIAAEEAQE
jgi:hypothetical protein